VDEARDLLVRSWLSLAPRLKKLFREQLGR